MSFLKHLTFSILILFSVAKDTYAQSEWKNWNTVAVTGHLSKKVAVRLGYLTSFIINEGYKMEFGQVAFQTDYFINKKFALRAGTQMTHPNYSSNDFDFRVRYYLRGTYKTKINKTFSLANSLQLEHHSQTRTSSWIERENRYSNRIIYVGRLALNKRLKFKNNLRFLNKYQLAPSLSYWLYYNMGGDSIPYYDQQTGDLITRNQPNGFHRGRFIININGKITDHMSLSLYYMNQSEFNLFSSEFRRMNSIRPDKPSTPNKNEYRVYRPFDDYNVLGLTALFDFDFYKKKKKSQANKPGSKKQPSKSPEKKKNENKEDLPL